MVVRQMFPKPWCLVILAAGFVAVCSAADSTTVTTREWTLHKGLVYSNAGPGLCLDLLVPKHVVGPTACIIVIQGGGFAAQDGQRFRPFAEYLAARGFAAALIAYRGRPNHHFRETIADTKAAVRYVREVSERYHIDAHRIGAMGRSAGGTLAALLAVTGGVEELEGKGGHPGLSSRIQAAAALAGVFNFVSRFTDKQQIALQPRVDAKIVSNGEWIGAPFSSISRDWLRASAIEYVDADDPPILFLHCKDDSTVPWLQSRQMNAAMRIVGVASQFKCYETGGHGFKGLDERPMADMTAFFRETLATP